MRYNTPQAWRFIKWWYSVIIVTWALWAWISKILYSWLFIDPSEHHFCNTDIKVQLFFFNRAAATFFFSSRVDPENDEHYWTFVKKKKKKKKIYIYLQARDTVVLIKKYWNSAVSLYGILCIMVQLVVRNHVTGCCAFWWYRNTFHKWNQRQDNEERDKMRHVNKSSRKMGEKDDFMKLHCLTHMSLYPNLLAFLDRIWGIIYNCLHAYSEWQRQTLEIIIIYI